MGRALIDDVKMSDRILERLRAMQQPYWLPVRGRSMFPLLREGDSVQVYPHCDPEVKLVRGWLILLEHEGMPVVHRYLGEIGACTTRRATTQENSPCSNSTIASVSLWRGSVAAKHAA